MDKDQMRVLVKNVDAQLFEIVNNLICSICQELFNKPVTTPCGHTFCNGCIKRVLSSKDNSGCPLCKNSFKRYGLQADEVKSTLTSICQELPAAFEKDVKELTKSLTGLEDLVRTSKLSQLYNQDLVKESKNQKPKPAASRKNKKPIEPEPVENDSGTFIPVLKRTKNVLEYASAKKKRLDDLVSISQTEPASNSSFSGSSELDKKLEKIEKLPPDKKVNEWFNAVGDNIYINSPGSSILEQTGLQGDKQEGEKSTMIRRDYNKSVVYSKNEGNVSTPVDPYEFVPSQNNNIIKRKRQKKSVGKKLPDFKALQSFSKESIKRNYILLDDSKEEDGAEEQAKDRPTEKEITASQKFDQLLSETKGEQKVSHVLYSASQSSSTQFLDVSYHSKIETVEKKKTPKVQKKLLEDVLFKSVEPSTTGKGKSRSKRKRSTENVKAGKKKKLFGESVAAKCSDVLEKTLIDGSKRGAVEPPPTKLGQLLKELLDDDIIYATRPANAPVRLPELNVESIDLVSPNPQVGATQTTQMIGFCTQEETPDERNFKRMVENMEKELNSTAYRIDDVKEKDEDECHPTEEECRPDEEKPVEENPKAESPISNNSCDLDEQVLKIPDDRLVEFLRLGKLTPIRKRTKTSVVKLVFPIGLSSLARRRALQNRVSPEAQVPKRQVCQVSTGIQTSQQTVSAMMQTSQVPRCSVTMQTSQEEKPSVEIQTTQRWTVSEEIQTSQTLVCQEIQTTQIGYESAQVQTTQLSQKANADLIATPIRKPSHQHRKIVKRKSFKDPESPLLLHSPEEQTHSEKDVIMDFEVEDDFENSWKMQKHKHLVELKNKKNKERNEKTARLKSGDVDSDDSDVQPPKRRGTYRIVSQDPTGIVEDYETRQLIPLDVKKVHQDEDVEIVDLDTPKSLNSEEQMMRVLKNIDLDLPRGKSVARGEKSEESDSDFFVEQTPPRATSRAIEDIRNLSRSRSLTQAFQKPPENESQKKENSEGTDLICDSIPKGFSESFLLLSAPQRIPLSPEKNSKEESPRKTLKIDPKGDLPDENDQNQLNAFDGRTKLDSKMVQLKAAVDAWKRPETSPAPFRATPLKKVSVVASSVKNPDLIKKFASRFKVEYLNKPTKDMTHLIVGLHENDDKEVLPLCTPKLLFAMANKKWVVSELWAETSLKMNLILPEENFETPDPVGGGGCRKARLSGEQLLKNCEVHLLGEFQMISKEELADLIIDCGGTLVSSPEKFSFLPSKLRMIVADRDCLKLNEKQLQDLYQKHSTVVLSRDVIIMSIQSYKLVNFSPYLLHPASEECLVKLGYPSPLVRSEEEDEEEEEGVEAREDGNRSIAR